MSIDANEIMSFLLSSFESNQTPTGGWYIETALHKIPWNHHFSSLKALDALISSHRTQRGLPDANLFLVDLDKRNTLLLLSAYLGKVLQHSTGEHAHWFSHADFVAANPKEHGHIPHTFASSLVLKLGEQWVLPISLLCDQLFYQDASQNISRHVENIALRSHLFQTSNTSQWMHTLLQLVQQHGQIPAGFAYADLVMTQTWDYSLPSLEQLDALLQNVRQQYVYQADTWHTDSSQANFLLWVSAYLAATIANIGQCALRWWDHDEASQLMEQELAETIGSTRVAQIDQTLYFVLGYVSEYLLGNNEKSISQYAHFILSQLHNYPQTPFKLQAQPDPKAPMLWKKAMVNAGHTAAQLLQQLAASPSSQNMLLPTLFDGYSFQQALDDGITVEKHWQTNPQQRPYLSLAYEAHAHFATQRTEAIQIDTLVGNDNGEEFTISITVPFHGHQDYRGFRILRPYFTLLPQAHHVQLESLSSYFFQGVQQFEQQQAPFWKTYYGGDVVN